MATSEKKGLVRSEERSLRLGGYGHSWANPSSFHLFLGLQPLDTSSLHAFDTDFRVERQPVSCDQESHGSFHLPI